MRIASLSDLHLGAALPGRTSGGRPVRQVDIEAAWFRAVDQIIERRCDLVTIAGDVFDTVTPCTAAKAAYIDGLDTLSEAGCRVVVIGGNHETPRTAGVLSPNMLARRIAHVRVVNDAAGFPVRVPNGETAWIFACPFQALSGERIVQPEPGPADVNLLLIHAAVRSSARPGALPPMYGGATSYDVARAEGFDVVACGDFHEFRVLTGSESRELGDIERFRYHPAFGPLAFYSGSLERVSSNIWQEAAPKGWVLTDTDERTLEFVEVPTRAMFSYNVSEWTLGGPADLSGTNAALADLCSFPATADALVRLVVEDFPAAERHLIDQGLVRQLQQRCVLFRLDIRTASAALVEAGDRRGVQGQSVEDAASAFFAEDEPAVRDAALGFLGVHGGQEVAG